VHEIKMDGFVYSFGIFVLFLIFVVCVLNITLVDGFSDLGTLLNFKNGLNGPYIDIVLAFSISTIAGFLFYIYMWVMREEIRGSTWKNNSFINESIKNKILLSLVAISMLGGVSAASLLIYIQHDFITLKEDGNIDTKHKLTGSYATGLTVVSATTGTITLIPLIWYFILSIGQNSKLSRVKTPSGQKSVDS
jgi:hypothetical protein